MSAATENTRSASSTRLPAVLGMAASVLAGLAIPLAAFGPAPPGVALALAVILVLVAPSRLELLSALWRGLRTPLGLGLTAMFVLWLPSVVDSLDPLRSLQVWARMIGFIAAAALLFDFLRRSPRAGEACLRAIVISACACALVALVGIYAASPIYAVFRGGAAVKMDVALALKAYGSAVACLVPVVLWAGHRLGRSWRLLGFAYAAAGVVLIVAAKSNAGLLGLVVGAVVGVASSAAGLVRRSWLVLAAWAALVAVALIVVLARLPGLPPGEVIEQRGALEVGQAALPTWLVDAHRQGIWAFGRDRFLEAPVFGHGIDVSNFLPGASVRASFPSGEQEILPAHPHNWFLEVLLETGVVGAVALLAVLALLVRELSKRVPDRWSAAAAGALFAAFWSSSFFNFSVWAAWWQLTFLVLIAIIAAAADPATARPLSATRPAWLSPRKRRRAVAPAEPR